MERQFFSGNTIEQAVMAAARHYGLDPSRVAYKPRDKKHGFLNIRRRVVIEVDPAAPEKPEAAAEERASDAAAAAAAAPASPGPEEVAPGHLARGPSEVVRRGRDASERDSQKALREGPGPAAGPSPGFSSEPRSGPSPERLAGPSPEPAEPDAEAEGRSASPARPRRDEREDRADDEIWRHRQALEAEFGGERREGEEQEVAAFEKALDEILELVEMELEKTIRRREGVIEIELVGEDGEFLVERDGLVLRAIEHLLPRMVRGLLGYGLPCKLDCDGFQEAREREVRELAGGMAELARRQGRPQRMEPMSPADRRLVHLALADDPTVRTESEGSGYMKRVKVLPA